MRQDLVEWGDGLAQCGGRDVHVGLGGVYIGVTEKNLDHARARSLLDQVCGVRVAKGLGCDVLPNTAPLVHALEVSLDGRRMNGTRSVLSRGEQQIV